MEREFGSKRIAKRIVCVFNFKMAQLGLAAPMKFSVEEEPSTVGVRWKKWVRQFRIYIAATGITDKKRQKAVLLHVAGVEVQEVFETLPGSHGSEDLASALTLLDEHFTPKVNTPYERHKFRQVEQETRESVDQFVTRLKVKAATCEFGNKEDEFIRDQVIDKCVSNRMRKKFLEKGSDLTLESLREMARAIEEAERQTTEIDGKGEKGKAESQATSVNRIAHKDRKGGGGLGAIFAQ